MDTHVTASSPQSALPLGQAPLGSLACGAEELGLDCDITDFEGPSRNVNSRNSSSLETEPHVTNWPSARKMIWGHRLTLSSSEPVKEEELLFFTPYDLKEIHTLSLDVSYNFHLFLL